MVSARTPVVAYLLDNDHHVAPSSILFDSLLRQYVCHPELKEQIDSEFAEVCVRRDLPGCVDVSALHKVLMYFILRHETACPELNKVLHKVFEEVQTLESNHFEQVESDAESDLLSGRSNGAVDVTGGTKGAHAEMLRKREAIIYRLLLDGQHCRFCAEALHDSIVLELRKMPEDS